MTSRDPATVALKRLDSATRAGWVIARSAAPGEVDRTAFKASIAAGLAVDGLTDPQERILALLACPNARVREAALLAVSARGVAR